MISGIFGDIWAGNSPTNALNSYSDLSKLLYTHDLTADENQLTFKIDDWLIADEFEKQKNPSEKSAV